MAAYLTETNRVVACRPARPTPVPDPGAREQNGTALLARKRIFVSYVREDSAVVDNLVDELRERGFDIWLDRTHLLAGQKWKSEIKKAIRAGDYFIACFSPASTTKRLSYTNEELNLAVEHLRLMPRGRQWFIPVVLEHCTIPDLPIGPGETLDEHIQHVDLSVDWASGIAMLLRALGPPLVT